MSNCVTNVDSVTKFQEYIDRAAECGMTTFGFSEHGSTMEWYHKKMAIEAAGMKYAHGEECYLTESLDEKVRDNYHCVIMARNYDGFLELNRLVSASFNRKDNHFYYVPRISFDELFHTSDNIIFTTACVGGVFGKAEESVQDKFLNFMMKNKSRCFFEVGHHLDPKQLVYNDKLLSLSKETGIPLIAGTDTHALNADHEKGRSILQLSKNIHFDGEDMWDLKFKTFEELVFAYEVQGSLPESDYMQAIENTNVLADMIEPFEIDTSPKYPHICDNPDEAFRKKVYAAIETHPYALKNHSREELTEVIESELEVYKTTGAADFMLLQTHLREWERSQGIQCGYGRGSVSGSMVAYVLGITQMDSIRYGLNYFRFMNPARVSLADIDTDYAAEDRDRVKSFLLDEKMGLPNFETAEIITFNTIATKGAVRDVCRALYKDRDDINYISMANDINKQLVKDEKGKEIAPESTRKKYPDVFKYADIVNGTIVSIGTHPSGVLVSDLPLEELIGLCSISTTDHPVSMINMKELDALQFVKLDILGLDNIGLINDTCKELGIERLTPDNVDAEDMDVWRSIRDNTTLIFEWESNSAQQYLKRFMSDRTISIAKEKIPNFSMIKWLSFGNGLIRPGCASFRDQVADGVFFDNGLAPLNEFLAPEAGHIAMQETIMQFLVKFCGYSDAESDIVRRAIAKKKGTETLLPEIKRRFIETVANKYSVPIERGEQIIEPFLQAILDASSYSFSWNHSDPYSFTGYIAGYLRYYHPLEFLTAALNIFNDNATKTAEIVKYASRVGIAVTTPKWGISRRKYFYDKERRIIAKDLTSIKYMSAQLADDLYNLASDNAYRYFVDLLVDLDTKSCIDTRQLDSLIKLDFFSDFGNQRELLRITEMFYGLFKRGQVKQIKKSQVDGTPIGEIVQKYSAGTTKTGKDAKSYTILEVMPILRETEAAVMALHMDDLDDITKVQNFYDAMGYIGYVSGKQEDRPKLYVLDMYPLKRKKDQKQFGYSVIGKSIGSGKETRYTLFNRVFDKEPIKKGDIIRVLPNGYERDGQYFTLTKYERIS